MAGRDYRSKITLEQRDDIIAAKGRLSATLLAERYGLSRGRVCSIWGQDRKRNGTAFVVRLSGRPKKKGKVMPEQSNKVEYVELTAVGGKVFMDLDEQDCHWPIGRDEEGAQRFCACERHGGPGRLTQFYCDKHASVAVTNRRPWAQGIDRNTSHLFNHSHATAGMKEIYTPDLEDAA